jgi:hypothetical protein
MPFGLCIWTSYRGALISGRYTHIYDQLNLYISNKNLGSTHGDETSEISIVFPGKIHTSINNPETKYERQNGSEEKHD